ncbi:MAG: hypothetical protein IRY99_06705 [Isosphaeraceae bacterium]|nr:hypothetical protein [Isosphaeraceae bacterium]
MDDPPSRGRPRSDPKAADSNAMGYLALTMLALAAPVAEPGGTPRLMELRPTLARGVLVNLTAGSAPEAAIDPARPTVVVVHGVNVFAPLLRFALAERYAEVIARRHGAGVNVLGWDWNAATLAGLRPSVNHRHAIDQGHALAAALYRLGVEPAHLHFIAQSTGCLVSAAAARDLLSWTGRPVARLTLLDPITWHHPLIFEQLGASSCARLVEHYWAPGPSGFGREAPYPGVLNTRVDGPHGLLGLIRPLHTDHLHAVRWHLGTLGR